MGEGGGLSGGIVGRCAVGLLRTAFSFCVSSRSCLRVSLFLLLPRALEVGALVPTIVSRPLRNSVHVRGRAPPWLCLGCLGVCVCLCAGNTSSVSFPPSFSRLNLRLSALLVPRTASPLFLTQIHTSGRGGVGRCVCVCVCCRCRGAGLCVLTLFFLLFPSHSLVPLILSSLPGAYPPPSSIKQTHAHVHIHARIQVRGSGETL